MSVMMVLKVQADTDAFRSYVDSHAAELEQLSEDAKNQGGIHHRFAVGDGILLVINEWESADSFMSFFQGNEVVAEVMRAAGAQGEPEISIGEAIDAPGTY